jgi:hypothetical protein
LGIVDIYQKLVEDEQELTAHLTDEGDIQMKEGKVVNILAVEIMCEHCQEPCVDTAGSSMITSDSKTVTCDYCHEEYSVPSTAFVYKDTNSRRRSK